MRGPIAAQKALCSQVFDNGNALHQDELMRNHKT